MGDQTLSAPIWIKILWSDYVTKHHCHGDICLRNIFLEKLLLVTIVRRGRCKNIWIKGVGLDLRGLLHHPPMLGSPNGQWCTFHLVPHHHIWLSYLVYILELCTFIVPRGGCFENSVRRTDNVLKLLGDHFFRDPLITNQNKVDYFKHPHVDISVGPNLTKLSLSTWLSVC